MPGDTLTTHLDAFREAALSCPLPTAVELIGEKWAFLILRGALNGLKHFEEFQAGLGIARNILSARLSKMVAGGLLERAADPEHRRRVI
jgi:DNA-binding HxlR family transcriptional regulator